MTNLRIKYRIYDTQTVLDMVKQRILQKKNRCSWHSYSDKKKYENKQKAEKPPVKSANAEKKDKIIKSIINKHKKSSQKSQESQE